MSGPELTALAAALVALAGVGLLVLQVRRLRGDVATARADVAHGIRLAQPASPLRPVPAPEAGVKPRPAPVVEPLPGHGAQPRVEAPTRRWASAPVLTSSLVRVSALSYGVRRAMRAENRDRVRALVRRDLNRRHKVRRHEARRRTVRATTRVGVPIRPSGLPSRAGTREESAL